MTAFQAPIHRYTVRITHPPQTDGTEFAIRVSCRDRYTAQINALHLAWSWFHWSAPNGPRACRVDEIREIPLTLYECVEG